MAKFNQFQVTLAVAVPDESVKLTVGKEYTVLTSVGNSGYIVTNDRSVYSGYSGAEGRSPEVRTTENVPMEYFARKD